MATARPSINVGGNEGRSFGLQLLRSSIVQFTFPWAEQVFAVRRTIRHYKFIAPSQSETVGKQSIEILVGITCRTAITTDAASLLVLNREH